MMVDKSGDAMDRATNEVLTILKQLKDSEPEIAKGVMSPELVHDLLKTGLQMQFDGNPQKAKQSIRQHIRAKIKNEESA